MAASFLEKIISKLHEEGRYPKGLFDSPLSPVCCNKQPIHPSIYSLIQSFIHSPFIDPISLSFIVLLFMHSEP